MIIVVSFILQGRCEFNIFLLGYWQSVESVLIAVIFRSEVSFLRFCFGWSFVIFNFFYYIFGSGFRGRQRSFQTLRRLFIVQAVILLIELWIRFVWSFILSVESLISQVQIFILLVEMIFLLVISSIFFIKNWIQIFLTKIFFFSLCQRFSRIYTNFIRLFSQWFLQRFSRRSLYFSLRNWRWRLSFCVRRWSLKRDVAWSLRVSWVLRFRWG